MPSRISYQNWIAALGQGGDFQLGMENDAKESARTKRVEKWVNRALAKLTPSEREIITRHYLCGESLYDIARQLGKDPRRTTTIHRRAVIKLKKNLALFVRREFVLKGLSLPDCRLCRSPYRAEIEVIIRAKRKEETWHRIIARLKADYDIKIGTPQILISHQKYHMED